MSLTMNSRIPTISCFFRILPRFYRADGSLEPTKRSPFFDCRIVGFLTIVLYGLGAWLSQSRAFDQDEFFHLHAAWNIFIGWMPYRDFFEHHAPLYYFVLAPIFTLFRAETEANSAVEAIFFVRSIMWFISGIVLLETFWLGKLWRNTAVGVVAVFFVISTEIYWSTALEIRPDTLAVALFLASLIAMIQAMKPNVNAQSRSRALGWSGFLLGTAFVTLQKAVYTLPGIALATCWYFFSRQITEDRKSRISSIGRQSIGFCVPILFTAMYFYANGALSALINCNLLFNLKLSGFSAWPNLRGLAYQNPYLILFGVAGWIYQLFLVCRGQGLRRETYVLLPTAVSVLIGLFCIPVPYNQYYLWLLPLLALFAAVMLVDLTATLVVMRDQMLRRQWSLFACGIGLIVFSTLILIGHGANSHWPPQLVTGYWFAVFLILIFSTFLRLPPVAGSMVFLALAVPPSVRITSELRSTTPAPQLEEIRYIVETTAPTDTVLDGYSGSGIFRPSAYYYGMLPWNVRLALSDDVKEKLFTELREGGITPTLILLDRSLERFSPEVRDFVEQEYEPTGIGNIWKRT